MIQEIAMFAILATVVSQLDDLTRFFMVTIVHRRCDASELFYIQNDVAMTVATLRQKSIQKRF